MDPVDKKSSAQVLFLVISLVNRLHRKPAPPAAALSMDQKLLTEIRDELRKQREAPRPAEPRAVAIPAMPAGRGSGV